MSAELDTRAGDHPAMPLLYSGGKQHLGQEKPLISPVNLAQILNPRTVLKSARPEDSKTPPEW